MRHMPDRFLRGFGGGSSFTNKLPDKILKTKHLIFEKSEFLIDLKESSSGKQYLEITQTINKGKKNISGSIKVNPEILNTLVAALLKFDGQEEMAASIPKDRYGQDLEKIKSAYLKGSTLESLRLQFPDFTITKKRS